MKAIAEGIKDDKSGRIIRAGILIAADASLNPITPRGAGEGLGGYIITRSGLIEDRYVTAWFGRAHNGLTINTPRMLRAWLSDLTEFSSGPRWSSQDISQLAVATETFSNIREYGEKDGLSVIHTIGSNQAPAVINDARGLLYA